LLLLAVAIPCWYAWSRSVSKGMVEVNHVGLFTFGFLLYWIAPMLIGTYGLDFVVKAPAIWSGLFSRRVVGPYIAVCLGLYLCFMAGNSLGMRLFRRQAIQGTAVPVLILSMVTATASILAIVT